MSGNSARRAYAQPRPTSGGITFAVRQQTRGNQQFQPLPPPTGSAPYHLSLDRVLPADQISAIQSAGRMVLHIVGDTGGVKYPVPQQIVAMAQEQQFDGLDSAAHPSFFYHLGDIVYYYGEASEYYSQFYEPYSHYSAPIFAMPGNHDGDVMPGGAASLTAFVNNFCAPEPHITADAGEVTRDAMTQPNVYWTLDTPFATFVGLYSNVPEGGKFDDQQIAWFMNELRTAPEDKALIVSAHHPAYSADTEHSGSLYIQETLDQAFAQAGRAADLVFAGHVHNYQRFTRATGGRQIPYIVAGAGGYWNLHYVAKQPDGSPLKLPYALPGGDTTLESYCDSRHGFLRLTVTPQYVRGDYFAVSRPHEAWRAPAKQIDSFTLDLREHRLIDTGTAT